MLSLLLRNLLFTIVHPVLMAGFIPYWIVGRRAVAGSFSKQLNWYQYFAIFLFVAGTVILFHCIIRFAVEGRGTLSPVDPTKRLVVTGLYKFTRNPMYAGVMTILISESVFFQSASLWIYTAVMFIFFNLFIMLVEELRLHKDFGKQYDEYRKKVRRWI